MSSDERKWDRVGKNKETHPNRMSNLQKAHARDGVIAILCGDIHLSHKPPIARSNEKDWYEVMGRYLRQLSKLRHDIAGVEGLAHIPIICAGDLFHVYNPPPELVHWAMGAVPYMYAIPGQHDLPYHSYKDLHKTAFGILAKAERIRSLTPETPISIPILNKTGKGFVTLSLHGFPWGTPLAKLEERSAFTLHLAIVHSYVWIAGRAHAEASEAQALGSYKALRSYDAAVFGDNHKGFLAKYKETPVLNCGTFMRRRADEIHYAPMVGLLHVSGKITTHQLKTDKDVFLDQIDTLSNEPSVELEQVVDLLRSMSDASLDFVEAVKIAMQAKPIGNRTKQIIEEALSVVEA